MAEVTTHCLHFMLPPGGACNQTIPKSSTNTSKPLGLMEAQHRGSAAYFCLILRIDVSHASFSSFTIIHSP